VKIRGWHIDGFGIHRDWRVVDVSPGLTVFHGANEAGKSTLLAFLRGALFGYPDGRSRERKYPPVGGGAHGGRVTLIGPDGDVVVERFAGRGQKVAVTLEDGRKGDAADLAERLSHADAQLFHGVFAFGLGELQELGSLGDAGIQDHLFSAAVTGGGSSARQAVRDLYEASRDLFAGARSRKQDRAGELVAAIREAQVELFARQEAAERYPDLRDLEQSLARQVEALDVAVEGARADEQRARRLMELWSEVWSPLAEVREQLAKLAPTLPDVLPADASARLERSSQEIRALQDRLEGVRAERVAVAAQLEELRLDESARSVATRVAALQDQLALHLRNRERAGELAERQAESEARIAAALERLGDDLDEADLRALRPTAARRDELREWKQRIDVEQEERREAEAARRLLAGQVERARLRLTELGERLATEAPPDAAEALGARTHAVRGLRLLLPRLREVEADLQRRTAILMQREASETGVPGGLLVGSLLAVLVGAAGVGFFVSGRYELLVGGAIVVSAVLGLRVLQGRRDRGRQEGTRLEQEGAIEAGRRLEALRLEAAPFLEALSIDPAVLGDPTRSEEVLAGREVELEGARDRAGQRERVAAESRDAEAQCRSLEADCSREDGRVERSSERLARLEGEFGDWKSEAGVPALLTAESAGEFLEDARRGREALDERDRIASEARRLKVEVNTWNADVDSVLADSAGAPGTTPPASDEERTLALSRLRDRCDADRAAREGREPLERRGVDLRARFVACEGELAVSRGALQALLEEAGVAEVEELQRRIAAAEEAAKLQARVAAAEGELERRLEAAGVDEANRLREELPKGRVSEWEEHARRAGERVTLLQKERDGILRQHQDRARDRERLEESTGVMDFELMKTAREQELREVIDEWRRLRLAGRLIEAALERFEAKHQPGVLREASRLFASVTDGRYPRIVQSEGRTGFSVVTADGTHRSPEELSQGTTEQLYLCVRLGLVAELARGGRSLPVVMDDVLVNFDDQRAAAMARVLRDFATEHQVLFFTCSSWTRDLLVAAGSDVSLRSLDTPLC
jgi:uncharacterized protein YhaN